MSLIRALGGIAAAPAPPGGVGPLVVGAIWGLSSANEADRVEDKDVLTRNLGENTWHTAQTLDGTDVIFSYRGFVSRDGDRFPDARLSSNLLRGNTQSVNSVAIQLPAGNYIFDVGQGKDDTSDNKGIGTLYDGTGDADYSQPVTQIFARSFPTGAVGFTDAQMDQRFSWSDWYARDVAVRGEPFTITDRGSAALTGFRYEYNNALLPSTGNARINYIRIYAQA